MNREKLMKSIQNTELVSLIIVLCLLTSIVISPAMAEESPTNRKSISLSPKPGFSQALLKPTEERIESLNRDWKSPSPAKAFFFSLLLPGAGEYYAGAKNTAKIFFSAEVILWATYFGFRAYGHMKEDDYIRFAIAHAGIDPTGKDHDYYVNIENYNSIQEYNNVRLQERRVDELYPDTEFYAWQWDNQDSRLKYERLRIASDQAFNRSLFVLGAVVVNHVISGIDAIRVARAQRKADPNRIRVGITPLRHGGWELVVCKPF
jgi:hypothetical protein